jgi:hypothetical protein
MGRKLNGLRLLNTETIQYLKSPKEVNHEQYKSRFRFALVPNLPQTLLEECLETVSNYLLSNDSQLGKATLQNRGSVLTAQHIDNMSREEAIKTLALVPLILAKVIEKERLDDGPEWIRIKEAARFSGFSPFFFYDHWRKLSFCKKNGRSVILNRRGFLQWLASKSGS